MVRKILNERGNNYGQFKDHAKITQDLKKVMKNTPNWENLSDDQKEALEMTAHKIGRILNGWSTATKWRQTRKRR